jgi:hypothetical protein
MKGAVCCLGLCLVDEKRRDPVRNRRDFGFGSGRVGAGACLKSRVVAACVAELALGMTVRDVEVWLPAGPFNQQLCCCTALNHGCKLVCTAWWCRGSSWL